MLGPGRFVKDYGWKAFILISVFILLTDYILDKFIESEKTKSITLGILMILLAFLEFQFEFLSKLK